MDIDSAISKLNEFKRISSEIGNCDLMSLSDGSFTVKISFGEEEHDRKPIIGFCPQPKGNKANKKKQ